MLADEADLLDLADAVLDGRPIESDDLRASDRARALLPHFQAIAGIAALARAPSSTTGARSESAHRDWLPPQSTWGPLTIVAPVGHGSFGDVYRALDPRLDRPVALKLLRRRDRSPSADSAVVDEARLMARVRHPNVVTVFGAERVDGRVGLWMEFVDGRSLEDELKARGPLPQRELVAIGVDLCRALAAIHRAGLLHRDLKAQNVLRDGEGRVLVTDFGAGLELASLGEGESALAGTPLYLAPEIFTGGLASVQSDIYSLGVLLFHLATGAYPVTGRTLDEVRAAHRSGRHALLASVRRDLDSPLVQAVERAIAGDPAARYASADDMHRALAEALAAPAPRRRRWTAPAVAAGLVMALGVSWSAGLWRSAGTGASPRQLPERVLLPAAGLVGLPSPDGTAVPYIDGDGHARIWDVVAGRPLPLTGEAESVVANWDPVVSPDGRRIVFASQLDDESWALRMRDEVGNQRRPLIARQSAYRPVPLDWSRDGAFVLCWLRQQNGSTDLVLVPVDEGPPRVVRTLTGVEPLSARLSPDGRFVAATIGNPDPGIRTDLLVLDVEGGDARVLAEGAAPFSEPAWTPDGAGVFFLRPNETTKGSSDGWVVPLSDGRPSGDPARVAPDLGMVSWVHLTGTGHLIRVFRSITADVYTRSIDLAGGSPAGPPERVEPDQVGNHVAPAFSPDGRSLAYFRNRPAPAEGALPLKSLVIKDLTTGQVRELPTALAFLGGYSPEWAADSGSVAVWGRDEDRPERLGFYRVDVETGRTSPVVVRGVNDPAVSAHAPDGRAFLYWRPDRGIVSRDLSTGRERLVAGPDDSLGPFRLSPDGRVTAYTRFDRRGGSASLVVQPLGGTPRELLRVVQPDQIRVEAWTPDGESVLFSRATGYRPYRLWRVRVAGGAPLELAVSFIRTGGTEPNRLSLSPDGRQIAYTERVVEAELVYTPGGDWHRYTRK